MSERLHQSRGVHGTHEKRGIHEHMIERRFVEIRRNAKRRPTASAELNKFFHAASIPMEATSG